MHEYIYGSTLPDIINKKYMHGIYPVPKFWNLLNSNKFIEMKLKLTQWDCVTIGDLDYNNNLRVMVIKNG